jgi:enoyl-CoA hydratase/carnithine racemase
MTKFIELDVSAADASAGVATIRLHRPPVNALNRQMQEEIREAALECSQDDRVKSVVLWGGEKSFAAGADITEMETLSHAEMIRESARLQDCFRAVAQIPKPVIAAVTGYALGGGCELALCADFRFLAENAVLGQPEILLGIIPGAGGTQRLPRLIGASRAKELIFTGRRVFADEALRIGMCDRVFPADQVYSAAVDFAATFANSPALALRSAKESIDYGIETDLNTGLEIERQHFASLFATEDRRIGMESFRTEGPGKAQFVGR